MAERASARVLVAGWLLVLGACATVPAQPLDQQLIADADARVLEGCYDCLLEARHTFERLAVGPARALMLPRLFEVNVLIGLRDQDLALDPADAFGRAEALVPDLSPAYDAATYLAIARAIPPDFVGTPRAVTDAMRESLPSDQDFTAFQIGVDQGAGTAPFRAFLGASLECLRLFANRLSADTPPPAIPDTASPLVRYRMATCPALQITQLAHVLEAVPSFVEAGLFSARQPTLTFSYEYRRNLRAWLTAALTRFPQSPSVTYSFGALHQINGDCTAAVQQYDATMALAPLHENAALQRVICLAHTGRFAPAIEGATQIIKRDYYNTVEAYYWRAWTRHRQGDLPTARADIDTALTFERPNEAVFTLGGIIKYDQGELDSAERDLIRAIRMDPRNNNCQARWYHGLVGFAREQWADTATRFITAGTCYRQSADAAVRSRDQINAANVDEAFRASQIAGFDAVIKEDRDQEHASYLNAANCFARAGQPKMAEEWLARIPTDSAHAIVAAALRKQIGGT
jgi:tetratricopeptide (TPR) repeat protein